MSKSFLLPLLATAGLCLASSAVAGTRTWTGGGTDNKWSTSANWDSGAPVNNDSVVFNGATRLQPTNDVLTPPLIINGISFTASSFNLLGQAITNTGGLYDSNGNNTNNMAQTLAVSQSFTNAGTFTNVNAGTINVTNAGVNLSVDTSSSLLLNGVISGNGMVTVLGGLGGVTRLGAANTFKGGVAINSGGNVQVGNAGAFPNGAGFGDVTNNGTINLNATSITVNGLYGSGTVDNLSGTAAYTLTVGNNSVNSAGNFTGTIQNSSGTIALTKVNANTFTLNGSGNYTGPTAINGGTFVLGASGGLFSTPAITVSPGAVFDISASSFALQSGQTLTAGRTTNGGPSDVIGDPNGSGKIEIYRAGAAGTLTLSGGLTLSSAAINYDLGTSTSVGGGANDLIAINGQLTLNGTTTIRLNPFVGAFAAGTYTLISNQMSLVTGSPANLAADAPRGITATFDTTTKPGGLLMGVSGSFAPASLVWSGSVSGDWDDQQTKNWLNGLTADYFYNLDNVTFNDSTVNANVNLPSGVSPSSVTVNNSASNYVFSGSGSISGPGSFTKSGSAQGTFRNANTFVGNTVITGGTLQFDVGNAAAPLTQIFYNGVAAGTLTMSGGTVTTTSRANSTSYQLFSGTTFNAGTSTVFQPGRTSSSHPAIFLGGVTRNVGATVDFQPQTRSSGSQTDGGTGIFTTTANNYTTPNGTVGGWATWNAAFGTAEFARVNTSAGSQGGTHIYGGATYTNFFAATTNTEMTADLTVAANTNTSSLRFNSASARTLTLNGNNVITSGGILVGSGVGANNSTITGGTSLTSGNGLDLIVHQYDTTGNLIINSVIADNGATSIALTKAGGGALVLAGANTFTGPVYINAGTVQLGNSGASGSIASSSGVTNNGTLAFKRSDSVTFALPITGTGGLSQLGTGSVTLTGNNAYSGATTVSAGTLQVGNGATAGNLGNTPSITDNGTLIFNRSDNVAFSGPIPGSGGLVQQGAGTLTLTGVNTYQGNTAINAGSLVIGATAAPTNSAALIVGVGTALDVSALGNLTLTGGTIQQILAGTGTVKGSVTTSSGVGAGTRITPGTNGVYGTLTITNALTLNGGTISFDISSGSKDLIVVGGNLALNGGAIALNVSGTLANGRYKLIQYAGSLSGSALNIAISGFSQPGQVPALDTSVAGELDLVVSSYVPVNLTWQGNGTSNPWDDAITADWTNSAGTAVVFHQFDNVIFDDTSANTTANLSGSLTPSQVTVNGTVNSYTLQGSGSIAGGNVTNNNPNTLTILTANSYSGNTTINAGTVQFGNGSVAGTVDGGNIYNNSALVFNEPNDQIVGGAISGAGTVTHSTATTLTLTANSTLSGLVTISSGTLQVGAGAGGGPSGSLGAAPVTDNGTLVLNRSGSLTVSGAISGSGTLINDGGGTVTLSGANSYVNNTAISNGIVKLGNSAAVPSGGSTTGWLILDGGATAGALDLNGFNGTVNALSGLTGASLGRIVNDGGTGTNILTILETAATTFAGRILDNDGSGGKVGLVMNGANTLTLQPGGTGSSYSGGTLITNGTISGGSSTTANATMCGTGPVTFAGTNGALQLGGFTGSTTPDYGVFPNPVILQPNASGTVFGTCRGGGFVPATVTGPASSTLILVTRYVRGSWGGNWDGFSGLLIVSNNTASANTDFRLNTATGFPNARVLLAAGGTGGAYMYNLVTGTPIIPIGELSGDATATIALNAGAASGQAAIWSVGGLNTSAEYDGGITDTHGIIKVGTGNWTLTSGNLPYSGQSTISNGVLVLGASATLPNSTPITISAPGKLDVSAAGSISLGSSAAQTLQGNGTINGSLTVGAQGTVAVGFANGIGTLIVTNAANFSGGTVIQMELNRTNSPGTNDQIAAASITYGGSLSVANVGPALHAGDTFKLFKAPVLSGTFSATNLPATDASGTVYTWTNNLPGDGTITVLTAVPPPVSLTNSLSGSSLTLSWPASQGWRLQTNSVSVTTPSWFDYPGSTSINSVTITVNPAKTNVYYRLINP
jgi:autotransporter-associated beta strand protein